MTSAGIADPECTQYFIRELFNLVEANNRSSEINSEILVGNVRIVKPEQNLRVNFVQYYVKKII